MDSEVGFFDDNSPPPPQNNRPPFMRLLLIAVVIFGGVLAAQIFFRSPETVAIPTATITPTADIDLTATEIIRQATLTNQPASANIVDLMTTASASQATRTAIVRDPSLAQPVTPAPIELTITALPLTMQAVEGTPQPTTGDCWLAVVIAGNAGLQESLETDLTAAGITPFYVGVQQFGVQREDCSVDASETTFDLVIDVSQDQANLDRIHDLIAEILAVLSGYPVDSSFGPRPARLRLEFTGAEIEDLGYIDTGYANALSAYAEGLRGRNLIKALGGFVAY
ncbi:MAG: hypothetical protein K8L97_00970 [Anaerolineae bacterium]|nr:hypothetical protein [Anaerolineae bacterium]